MALANANGRGFTKADFIDKFAPKYWATGDKCGGLTLEQIKELAKDLGLARDIQESNDFAVAPITYGVSRFPAFWSTQKEI